MTANVEAGRPLTLVVNVAVIGLALSVLGMAWTGAWYMSQQSASAASLNERVKSNNDNVTERLNQILATLNERVVNSNQAVTERMVRFEKDIVSRREQIDRRAEQVDKRDDEQARALAALDGRVTRLEAQREFGAATGVRR